jgi:hypothetical protein
MQPSRAPKTRDGEAAARIGNPPKAIPLKTKSGVDGKVPMLEPNDLTSWSIWKEAMSGYSMATYPLIGNCLALGAYEVIVAPTLATLPAGIPAALKNAMLEQAWKDHMKEIVAGKREKKLLSGAMIQSLSAASFLILKSHADYSISLDPVAMYKILEQTHLYKTGNMSTKQTITMTTNRYAQMRQYPKEDIADFRNRFKSMVVHYNHILGARAIPEEQYTMDFIHKLDSTRYRDFQSEVKRAEDMGQAGSVPVTLAAAVSLCLTVCNTLGLGAAKRFGARGSYPSVFLADVDESEAGERAPKSAAHIKCFGCGKMGHYRSDCTAKTPKRAREEVVGEAKGKKAKVSLAVAAAAQVAENDSEDESEEGPYVERGRREF